MLEWYRANEPYETLMDDCAALMAEAARAAGAKQFTFRDKTIDPFAEPERVTVAEAFERHAGVDLLATVTDGKGDRARLAAAAAKAGVDHRGGRHLGRYLQPDSGRARRAAARRRSRHRIIRVPAAAGGAGAGQARQR